MTKKMPVALFVAALGIAAPVIAASADCCAAGAVCMLPAIVND